jgi:hypothetical protein
LSVELSIWRCTLSYATRKQAPRDLTGIRQRGSTYQVRVSAGLDPVTGRQLVLSGSADTEDAAIVIRHRLRQQVRDNTAARTNVTLGYLADEWLSGHQVEETIHAMLTRRPTIGKRKYNFINSLPPVRSTAGYYGSQKPLV